MERKAGIAEARQIFGENFIGPDEILKTAPRSGIRIPLAIPEIPYQKTELKRLAADYILILGSDTMTDEGVVDLLSLRGRFGTDPGVKEPCFYNQDWYLNEEFARKTPECKWYLVRKVVFEDSRAVLPSVLEERYSFPSAILCTYTFFVYWFHKGEMLWKNDFVWCCDTDHNGDRIYVGRYSDNTGVNKNGFNIHRHLSLRNSYAAISVL